MALNKSGKGTVNGYKIGPNANLGDADLQGANLLFANFSGVTADAENLTLIEDAIRETAKQTIRSLRRYSGHGSEKVPYPRAKNSQRGRYGR
jgi:uncharacterized protein YjbI with pentapeptide repeats